MKIKSNGIRTIIIDVLPEDEALVLEYLRLRKFELAAIKLVEDELITDIDFRNCRWNRIEAEENYSAILQTRMNSANHKKHNFSDFFWELDED
jgi:hypothetical protein